MRVEKRQNILEITENVKIKQEDYDIILEKGDRIKILTESFNKLVISIGSKVNADGFEATVFYGRDQIQFNQQYSYGYNASYSPSLSNSSKPYTTDIIVDICNEYKINRSNIFVTAGQNVFTGRPVENVAVLKFKQEYLSDYALNGRL